MEILSFDVCGKMAHFRKYYANNTAFSYSMPPRTTVMGMLAAVLGYERDTYYERLASKHLRIGVRVLRPVKKTFHRLNFLSIKSRGDALEGTGDFTGANGRIQTPFEVVTGHHLGRDMVVYRVFVAPCAENNGEFLRLKAALLYRQQKYNLTLGTANFSAYIEKAQLHSNIDAQKSENLLKIHSAVPSDQVGRLEFLKEDPTDGYNYLEEEMMPADFVADGNRELSKLLRVLFSTEGKPFSIVLNASFYAVPDDVGELQNIVFLE